MDLGRYLLGQSVRVGIDTVDADGNPAAPDSAPTATISGPVSLGPMKLAMDGGSTSFSLSLFLGGGLALGTYTVTYAYSVNGFNGSGTDTFDLIQGGDIGGRILSMTSYARPEAQYVVCQLASGRLVQGRNPRL